MKGKVREAVEQSVARILVGLDGILMMEAEVHGLLGLDDHTALQQHSAANEANMAYLMLEE